MELDGKETLPPPRKLSEMDAPIPEPRPQTRFEEMEEMFGAIVGEIKERRWAGVTNTNSRSKAKSPTG